MIKQKIWRLDNMACAGPNGELEGSKLRPVQSRLRLNFSHLQLEKRENFATRFCLDGHKIKGQAVETFT